ncbi:MAG: AMP-binding protein, partial [Chlamydiia bacterium]|nr:AMP-binding protein [Chlamydiia bacterium]
SGVGSFMRMVDALPIPNFETSTNAWKVKQAQKTYQKIKEGLARGQNFLIYPSGHLRRAPHEMVGGSLVHDLLEECPNAKVVLVRTSGLWGSAFSRALTGALPDFWKVLWKGFKTILKNGFFFVPKRSVNIEMCLAPDDFPRGADRRTLNRYIEDWFNRYIDAQGNTVTAEPVTLVSYSLWSEDLPQITAPTAKDIDDVKIDPKLRKSIIAYLAEITELDPAKITDETDLVRDLGLDSLDVGNVCAFIDEKYHISSMAPGEMKKVSDLCKAASSEPEMSGLNIPAYERKKKWPEEKNRPQFRSPQARTLPEAFLWATDRLKNFAACADGMTGPLSYKDVRRAALILADKISKMPGKYVGIMLPSSVAVNLVIQASWLAGKIPVMLNWTSGVRSLNFAHELLTLETVITSRRFLDRLDVLDLGDLEESVVLLEDLKETISLKDKLRGVWMASKNNRLLLDELNLSALVPGDTAVILFTSGTETYPKAVPLTHKNILDNQKSASSCVEFQSNDIMYSVLPPFHSFGFSITGVFPLLNGVRVFFSPDPTDGSAMARDIAHWKTTIMCCAPSFYKNLFRVAEKHQLQSMRYFVSGAEKAPEELFRLIHELGPDKQLLEGYGITECSPVVTIARSDNAHGVGQPIPGIEIRTIHAESLEPLPPGAKGEICISGSSVFGGYLGLDAKNPFITIEGERYYRSGDIGYLDAEDCLILDGRLKRFVKIGGEMISLSSIEEELTKHALLHKLVEDDDDPAFAIGVKQESEPPHLILFTTLQLAREDINQALRSAGFGRVVKVHEVRQIDTIPVTGTGKVHYRVLDELL